MKERNNSPSGIILTRYVEPWTA